MASVGKPSTGPPPGTLVPKLFPESGLTPGKVASHQRARLLAAMIEVVAERGYRGATARALTRLSRVSSRTMYEHFPNKEGYFLATFDLIVRRAVKNVNTAFLSEGDRTRQLEVAFGAFAQEVVQQPKAARLALVEALGAGPAALVRMERASEAFEGLIQSSFERAPDGVTLPPLVARGIVGGISRVVRQLLIDGREDELPSLADELVRWVLAYRSPSAERLPIAPEPQFRKRQPPDESPRQDDRERVLHAAARIAAGDGYESLTVERIVQFSGVPEEAFFSLFKTPSECFLASYDLLGSLVVEAAAEAAANARNWIEGMEDGIAALMRRLGRDPVFARIAFVEVFSAGPAGIGRRSELMQSFTDLLMSNVPAIDRPLEVVAEAIVGAVWQIAHSYVLRGAAHQLPELTDHPTYMVLAPIIGAEAAMERILGTAGAHKEKSR